MRRLIAILMLVVFALPMLSASLAQGEGMGAGLPACCRRAGAHHCMQGMAPSGSAASSERSWKSPVERCPYCPAAMNGVHVDPLVSSAVLSTWAQMHGPEARVRAAACQRRVARAGARQKRGPPAAFLG